MPGFEPRSSSVADVDGVIAALVNHDEDVYTEVLNSLLDFMSSHGYPDEV